MALTRLTNPRINRIKAAPISPPTSPSTSLHPSRSSRFPIFWSAS